MVYPEGVWYSGVTPADVPELVASHFGQGVPVRRLANTNAEAVRQEVQTNRNRYLQSVRAREAAGVMPDDLQQTIRGFQESQSSSRPSSSTRSPLYRQGCDRGRRLRRAWGTDARATGNAAERADGPGDCWKSGEKVSQCTPLAERYLVAGAPFDSRGAHGAT